MAETPSTTETFDHFVATRAVRHPEAVRYARTHIGAARSELALSP